MLLKQVRQLLELETLVTLDCCFPFLCPQPFQTQQQNGLHGYAAVPYPKDSSMSCSTTTTQVERKPLQEPVQLPTPFLLG